MRSKEAFRNTIYSFSSYVLIVVIGFISQRVFVEVLGNEYLGIHSLFSNIMTMLAIVELGFGSAIITNLYKPVAENNVQLINELLMYYKKVYRYIATIVLIIGLIMMPFIDKIVGKTILSINFKFIFLFYLIDTVSSYLISYKRSIIYANQKTYYINIVHAIIIFLMNIFQILILLFTGNYYIYLIIKVTCRIMENIIINIIANNKYPFIKQTINTTLSKKIKDDIIRKVKGLLFHQIGTFTVYGTDSILISIIPGLGIKWVGLYSNYLLITNQLANIIEEVFRSITASIGNLIIEENSEKNYTVFKALLLADAWIYTYVSISLYFVSKPFISIWLGTQYLFDDYIVLALVINFYFNGMRHAYILFKEAAGIFYEDRMVPLIESVVNLIVSIIAGYYLGIIGVFIGTICSNGVLFLYSFPKYVYKKILRKSYSQYIKELVQYFILFIISLLLNYLVIMNIIVNNIFASFVIKIIVTFIVSNLFLLIIKINSKEFKYLCNMFRRVIKK